MVPGAKNTKDQQSISSYIRRAHFAGSWYQSDPSDLNIALDTYIQEAQSGDNDSIHFATEAAGGGHNVHSTTKSLSSSVYMKTPSIRAIIAPHAGYRYSGPTAAYSYVALKQFFQESSVAFHKHKNRSAESEKYSVAIIILHPSHHCYLDGCAISGASIIETPLMDLTVDENLRSELLNTGDFSIMDRQIDEAEHSGEMQYPFIAKMYQEYQSSLPPNCTNTIQIRILPIMVGALSTLKEEYFGNLLSPILSRPYICTIISSDFCHWGSRFRFSPIPPTNTKQQIYEYIEWLDRLGMNHISMQQPGAFATYLKQYNNTICGRHPIGVWLHSIAKNNRDQPLEVTFVHYKQSSLVTSNQDSSVSYAAAIAKLSMNEKMG